MKAVSFSFFPRTPYVSAKNKAGKKLQKARQRGKRTRDKDQPTDQGTYPDMDDP